VNLEIEVWKLLEAADAERATMDPGVDRVNTDAAIEDIRVCLNSIITRRQTREMEDDRAAKRAELLPQCSAARELYESILREFQPCNDHAVVCQSKFNQAQENLAFHLQNPPPPDSYPSPREKRAWQERANHLRSLVEDRQKTLLAAVEAQQDLQGRYVEAKKAFEEVSFAERQLRPVEPQPELVPVAFRLRYEPEITRVG
jgi:hypothetical protein